MYIIIISNSKYLVYRYVLEAFYCTIYRIFYMLHTVYQHFLATKKSPTLNPQLPHLMHESPTLNPQLPHLKHESPTSVTEKVFVLCCL